MRIEPEVTGADARSYVLPRYVRYARALALVSGAAIGIASGAAVISSSGCGCNGFCGSSPGLPPIHRDSSVGPDTADADDGTVTDATVTDATAPDATAFDAALDAGSADASDTGGGPRPAPLLPRAWIA